MTANTRGNRVLLNRKTTKLLIRLYIENECLYNTSHEHFYNRQEKLRCMKSIHQELQKLIPNLELDYIQSKIRTLRTQYAHELVILEGMEIAGIPYTPKLWCFKYLNFLRKFMSRLSSTENSDNSDNSDDLTEGKQNSGPKKPRLVNFKWNRELTEQFIKLLESKKCLYDRNDIDFKNRKKKYEARKQLIEDMRHIAPSIKMQDICLKQKCLRDRYVKEMKLIIQAKATNIPYQPKLWCFQMLSFFDIFKNSTSKHLSKYAAEDTEYFANINGRDFNGDSQIDDNDDEDTTNDVIADLEKSKNCQQFDDLGGCSIGEVGKNADLPEIISDVREDGVVCAERCKDLYEQFKDFDSNSNVFTVESDDLNKLSNIIGVADRVEVVDTVEAEKSEEICDQLNDSQGEDSDDAEKSGDLCEQFNCMGGDEVEYDEIFLKSDKCSYVELLPLEYNGKKSNELHSEQQQAMKDHFKSEGDTNEFLDKDQECKSYGCKCELQRNKYEWLGNMVTSQIDDILPSYRSQFAWDIQCLVRKYILKSKDNVKDIECKERQFHVDHIENLML